MVKWGTVGSPVAKQHKRTSKRMKSILVDQHSECDMLMGKMKYVKLQTYVRDLFRLHMF